MDEPGPMLGRATGWPRGITLALGLALSLGSLDAITTLLTRPARFATLSGVALPVLATATATLATWPLALLLLRRIVGRSLGERFDLFVISFVVAAAVLFVLIALTGLLKWHLFLTDLFTLVLLLSIVGLLGAALYLAFAGSAAQPAMRRWVAAGGLAVPTLLLETVGILWLNFYQLGRFLALESIVANVAFAAAVAGTLVLALRWAPRQTPFPLVASMGMLVLVTLLPALRSGHQETGRGTRARAVKHILLVSVDTLRADALSSYGAGVETPEIDSLARNGILFERALSPAPWTPPAMASILTGTSPDVHLVAGFRSKLPDRLPTAAEYLLGAGYRTGAVGESPVLAPVEKHFLRGFEDHDFYPRLPADGSLGTGLLNRLWPDDYRIEGGADRVTGMAEAWLERHRAEAFFLWVHYFDPHSPYAPPEEDARRARVPLDMGRSFWDVEGVRAGHVVPSLAERDWIRALYRGEVLYLDRSLGRLWQKLRQLGLYEDTLIVFTADHGEEFWEHGGFTHGQSLYTELLWVPLVVKPPKWSSPVRVTTRVSTADVLPTFLDLCAVPPVVDGLSGRSLRPLWEPGAGVYEERPLPAAGVALYEPRVGVAFAHYSYSRNLVTGREEIYDLSVDWGERDLLNPPPPGLLDRARSLLADDVQRSAALRARYGIHRAEQLDLDRERLEELKALGYVR